MEFLKMETLFWYFTITNACVEGLHNTCTCTSWRIK